MSDQCPINVRPVSDRSSFCPQVRVYNLAQQALAKKLVGGSGAATCIALHPSGDHLLVGSEDKRVAWCVRRGLLVMPSAIVARMRGAASDYGLLQRAIVGFHNLRSRHFPRASLPRYLARCFSTLGSYQNKASVCEKNQNKYHHLPRRYDLDLSTKPYKALRYHAQPLRGVAFHRSYPLFASASDDGAVHVFHGTVYADLLTNPLIVPVKILRGHTVTDYSGVMDVAFHPTQPWVFTAGADSTICLFCN